VAVVAVAVVGGFWPAVLPAVTASLLVNWYFTPPVHTLTIADGKSLLALLLFVTVAVTVSSVVHLAALRARQAARSTEEAEDLLALAQTVLGGEDTPAAVLRYLTASHGGRAELLERTGEQWIGVHVLPVGRDDYQHQQADCQRDPGRVGDVGEPAGGKDEQDFLSRVSDRRKGVTREDRQSDLLRQKRVAEPFALHGPADEQSLHGSEAHGHERMLGPGSRAMLSLTANGLRALVPP